MRAICIKTSTPTIADGEIFFKRFRIYRYKKIKNINSIFDFEVEDETILNGCAFTWLALTEDELEEMFVKIK